MHPITHPALHPTGALRRTALAWTFMLGTGWMLAPPAVQAQSTLTAPQLTPSAVQTQGPVVEPVPGKEVIPMGEALRRATATNPGLAAARAEVAIAQAVKRKAWSTWQPELSAQGSFVRTSAPAAFDLAGLVNVVAQAYGLPAPDPKRLPPPVEIVGRDSWYGQLQFSQPLFSPEGLFLISPASAGAEAAALGQREAQEQVLLAVARTYLGLQGVQGLLAAARDAEAVALKREKDARAQLNAGTTVELSLLRAQSETTQARTHISELEGQREALLSLLEALVGSPVQPTVEPGELPLPPPAGEAEAPWEQTYRVRAAQKVVEAAGGKVRYDRFAWLPRLDAVARGNATSNAGFSGEMRSYDLILALNLPLYDRGLRYATLDEDEAKLRKAEAELSLARAQAKAAWVAARAQVEAANAVLSQARSHLEVASRAQKQTETAYRAGVVTNLELSDADIRRYLAASNLAQAQAQLGIRRAELAAAEGKLQGTGDLPRSE